MTTTPLTRRFGLLALAGSLILASCGNDTADEPVAAADENVAEVAGDSEAGDDPSPAIDTTEPDPVTTEPADIEPADLTKPVVQLPVELPVGLVITNLIEGTGDPAELGDTVELHYVGVLSIDGTEFGNSYGDGLPIVAIAGTTELPTGLAQGLVGVQQGGRTQLDIPAELAYGDQGAGDVIKPGDAITFVIDVLSVTKRVPVTAPPMADPSECPATDGSEEPQQEFDEYPPFCIDVDKTYTAEIISNFGNITIELDPQKAPLAVNSFVTLARNNYFDGTECHRALPGFVVQCGDPTASGTGGPGYRFADELPLPGEYEIGSIAMANSGPGTNGSQFFIISGPRGAALPARYSLFGTMIAGATTVVEMDAVANPEDNGVPPLEQIIIESVTITES